MALPASWTQVPVVGRFVGRDGKPIARGRLLFASTQLVVVSGVVIVPRTIEIRLTEDGEVPPGTTIPATDDPVLSHPGWAYEVHEQWPGGRPPYRTFVEYDRPSLDMSDIAPVVPPDQLESTRGPPGDITPALEALRDDVIDAQTEAQNAAGAAVQTAQNAATAATAAIASTIAIRDDAAARALAAAASAAAAEASRLLGATIGATTVATLPTPGTAGRLALVTNDPTMENNGTYRDTGTAWVKAADRVSTIENTTVGYRAAGDPIRPEVMPGFAWAITDNNGKAAVGVRDDGTLVASAIDGLSSVSVGDTVIGERRLSAGYAWSVEDPAGNVALGVRADGTVDIGTYGRSPPARPERFGGRFQHQINYINGAGQSLAYGASGAITTAQEYDNVMFPRGSVSPTAFVPASRPDGEDPTFGTSGHAKQLILRENGLTWQANDYQLCVTNNAVPNMNIDNLSKGGSTGAYEAALSQVAAGAALAASMGRSFAFRAVTWTQGEADSAAAKDVYKAKEMALADSFNTDGKLATGQTQDVVFITYQNASNGNKSVPVAQWEAANEHPLIYLATPMYFMDYSDFQHINNVSSKLLGGYYGLVYKRVVVDGENWEPLQPRGVQPVGNHVDITFNKSGLVLDTTLMPAQTNFGFSVDNAGAAVAITSVAVLPGNRVRLTLAAPAQPGWKVRYGHNSVTGKTPFVGGGGNLRDRQGDVIKYANKPLHNWCVIFDWEL